MTTVPTLYMHQNYHPEYEAAINNQINLELHASYVYLAMASYFNSQEVALKQVAEFFLQQSSKEREHAHRLIELQNQRGGCLHLHDIYSPDPSCWENGLRAMECAFHLEMSVNQSLLDLHRLAAKMRDVHLCAFLRSQLLQHHVEFILVLADHITKLRQMGATESSLAEDLCAKLTLGDSNKKN